jgi:hypothetical protein
MNFVTIDKKIKQISEINPNKVAIEHKDEKVTYAELDRNSDIIANFLMNKYEENNNVFVLMEKSPRLIESMIGIIKSNGIFIPLDFNTPDNRILSMFNEVPAGWIITTTKFLEKINNICSLMQNTRDHRSFYANITRQYNESQLNPYENARRNRRQELETQAREQATITLENGKLMNSARKGNSYRTFFHGYSAFDCDLLKEVAKNMNASEHLGFNYEYGAHIKIINGGDPDEEFIELPSCVLKMNWSSYFKPEKD